MRTWAQRRWWLLKTIIAVSQLSIYGIVAQWSNSKGAQETVELQEMNKPQPGLVTQLTRHETLDLFGLVRRSPLRQVGKQELASGKQHWHKKVFQLASQTIVEEGQHFVTRSASLLENRGITNTCGDYTTPRDDLKAEPKSVFGDNTNIGPLHNVLVTPT